MTEAILEPDLPIIDPHHHLWDRLGWCAAAGRPPSTTSKTVIALAPRYLLDELLADMTSGHKVIATVFMECGAMYRRTGPRPCVRSARPSSSTASRP